MSDSMRAARLVELGRIECVSAPIPVPGEGELLVETIVATICGSDLHTVGAGLGVDSYPCRCGFPGHEAVGRVAETAVSGFSPGDLVLLVPDGSCNAAFADYQCVPERFAIKLDDQWDPMLIVIAQQLGTVVFALRRFWPTGTPQTAAVIGCGPAGLMFIEQLKAAGSEQIIASDLERHRLSEAVSRGATVTVDARSASVVAAVLDYTGGEGADLVIEAAGHDSTRAEAIASVAIHGTIGLFGLPERPGMAPLPLELLFSRRPTIHVSNTAQHEPGLTSFRRAIDVIATTSAAHGLVTHILDIERVGDAFDLARSRSDRALKIGLHGSAGR